MRFAARLGRTAGCLGALVLAVAMASAAGASPTATESGRIASTFDVSPRGSASYSLPIRVAPGIGGLQPELALEYDSQNARNGPVGLGFQLSGVSAITPCGTTYRHDGKRTASFGTPFDTHARLCLDGVRLILADGRQGNQAYWAVGAEYRTDPESWSRVTRHGDCARPSAACTFTVEKPDGTVNTYGDGDIYSLGSATVDGPERRDSSAWLLTRTVDRHGNEMSFEYTKDLGVAYLSRVSYGGRSVALTYGIRPENSDVVRSGIGVSQRLRLERIEALIGDEPYRRYYLEYEQSPESSRSRLSRVLECSASDACLPATEITWYGGDADAPFAYTELSRRVRDLLSAEGALVHVGDFDGDGRADLLRQQKRGNAGAVVFYAEDRGFREFELPDDYKIPFGAGANVILGDFNGDGRTDFVRQERGKWAKDRVNTFSVFFARGDGDGFVEAQTTDPFIQSVSGAHGGCSLIPLDVNGDGKTDLLRQEGRGWDNDYRRSFQVWLSIGDGEFEIVQPGRETRGDRFQDLLRRDDKKIHIIPGDFNGDGLGDFAASHHGNDLSFEPLRLFLSRGDGGFVEKIAGANSTSLFGNNVKSDDYQDRMRGEDVNLITGDFNGDGRTDFIRQPKLGRDGLEVHFATAVTGLTSSIRVAQGFDVVDKTLIDEPASLKHAFLHAADFNGDGKTDILLQRRWNGNGEAPDESAVRYLSRGDGSFTRVDVTADRAVEKPMIAADWLHGYNLDLGGYTYYYGKTNLVAADFDGDGRTDVLGTPGRESAVPTYVIRTTPPRAGVFFADRYARLPDHLVYTIRSGNQLERRMEYAPLSRSAESRVSAYDPEYVEPSDDLTAELRGPLYVVREAVEQAIGDDRTARRRTYRYRGAVTSTAEGAFFGFSTVTVDAPEEGVRRVRHLLTDPILHGLTAREEVRRLADDAVLLDQSFEWVNKTSSKSPSRLIRLERETVRRYEGTSVVQSRATSIYDDYGFPVVETVEGFDGEVAHTCRTHGHDEETWRLGFLRKEKLSGDGDVEVAALSATCHGDTLAQVELVYDDNHNIAVQRNYDSHRQTWDETHFAYDGYGNQIQTIDPAGVIETTAYDGAFHTFPVRKVIDPGGAQLTSTFEVDPRFGLVVQRVDPAGNATIRRLDEFGRVTERAVRGSGDVAETRLETRTYRQQGRYVVTTFRHFDGESVRGTTAVSTDHLGRRVREERTGPVGATIVELTEWDAAGRRVRESEPHFADQDPSWTSFQYDERGRVVGATGASGLEVTNTFRVGGPECAPTEVRVETTRIDDRGEMGTRTRVECRNHLDKTTRRVFFYGAERTEQVLQYDVVGKLVAAWAQDENGTQVGPVTEYTYDSLGRRVATDHSERGRTDYEFVEGRLARKIRPSVGTIDHEYDSAGRLTAEVFPDGTEHRRIYGGGAGSRHSNGRVIAEQTILPGGAPGPARAYEHDSRGRVAKETLHIDGRDYVTSFAYGAYDELAEVTYPDNSVLRLDYDEAGNLRELALDNLIGDEYLPGTRIERGEHTARGQPRHVSFSNGVQTDYSYDHAGRLIRVSTGTPGAEPLMDRTISWSSFNEVISIDDGVDAAHSQVFGYDERGFLTSATGPYGAFEYRYDAWGNLLQRGSLTFSHIGDQVRGSSAGDVFDYDERGNRVRKANALGQTSYRYSALDQLVEVVHEVPGTCEPAAGGCPGSSVSVLDRFEYDATGARVKKVDASGVVSLYVSPWYEETIHPDGTRLATKYLIGPSGRLAAVTEEVEYDPVTPTGAVAAPGASLAVDSSPPFAAAVAMVFALAFLGLFAWHWIRAAAPRTRTGRARGAVLRFLNAQGWIAANTLEDGQRIHGTAFMRHRRGLAGFVPVVAVALVASMTACTAPVPSDIAKVADGRHGLIVLDSGMVHAPVRTSLLAGERGAGYPVAGTHFFHPDHLGSNTLVTDALGEPIAKAFYQPFGELYQPASEGADVYRSKFAGKEWDDGAQLFFFEARHYDPQVGRFVQADALVFGSDGELAADLNRYAYAANSPVVYTDPSGRAVAAGVALGTLVGALLSVGTAGIQAAVEGRRFTAVNAVQAFTIGAVTGALGGALGGGLKAGVVATGLFAKGAAGALTGTVTGTVTGFAGSALGNGIKGEALSWKKAGYEAMFGAIVGGLSGFVNGKFVEPYLKSRPARLIRAQRDRRYRAMGLRWLFGDHGMNEKDAASALKGAYEFIGDMSEKALADTSRASQFGYSPGSENLGKFTAKLVVGGVKKATTFRWKANVFERWLE